MEWKEQAVLPTFNVNKMNKIIIIAIGLVFLVSTVAIAWNPNPTYNPFEVIWNSLTDLFERTDELENGIIELDDKVDSLIYNLTNDG